MSFDLNKNEPLAKARTQFDLSKNETAETPKNKNWTIGLLLVLLIGGGLWYYLSLSPANLSESMETVKNPGKAATADEKPSGKALADENNVDSTGLIVKPEELNITTVVHHQHQ